MVAPPPSRALTHRETMVILGGLLSALALAALDQTIMATVLPTIVGDLGGLSDLSLVVTAYLVASTAATPLFGKASDFVEHRRMLHLAVAIFVSGSLLSSLATGIGQLIAFRALQGIGGGGIVAMTQVIIGALVSPRQRGRYLAYFTAVYLAASGAGPVVGGLLADHLSWRWIFLLNLPVGLAAAAWTRRTVPRSTPGPRHRVDGWGAALIVLSVACVVLATSWGGRRYAWDSGEMLALLAGAVAFPVALALVERRAADPVLPPRLLRNPVFALAALVSLLVGMLLFSCIFFIPALLQIVRGSSATVSGLLLLPFMSGLILATAAGGRLVVALGRYKAIVVAGTLLVAAGLLALSTIGRDGLGALPYVYTAVLGCGFGLVVQLLVLAGQNAAPPADLGTATATITLCRLLGGALGTAVFGALLTASVRGELGSPAAAAIGDTALRGSPEAIAALAPPTHDLVVDAFAAAMHHVFLLALPVALVMLVVALAMRELPLGERPLGRELGEPPA